MRLDDEIIDGFLVTGEQKRKNAVFLDLLQQFDRLCRRANITWWVVFGACIGAARHKGFSPWDDDVDVAVARPDFERLTVMTNEQFGAEGPYFLQNPVTDPLCAQSLLRFRRSDTTCIRGRDLAAIKEPPQGTAPYNMGLDLAIFPLDIQPASKPAETVQYKLSRLLAGAYFRAFDPDSRRPVRTFISGAMLRVLGPVGFFRLRHWPYRWFRKNRSGRVQILGHFYQQRTDYKAESFSAAVRLPFEDITVPVPVGYDEHLTTTYGDYMQFPPPEQRKCLHDGYERWDVPYTVSAAQLFSGEVSFPGKDQ